jgi:membrane protein
VQSQPVQSQPVQSQPVKGQPVKGVTDASPSRSEGGRRHHRVARFLTRDIWRRDWAEAPTFAALGVHVLRLVTIAGRGLVEHNQGLRAAALTYYTVLSLVPTLAFVFAVAKGFGAYEMLDQQVLRPLIETTFQGEEEFTGPVDTALAGELPNSDSATVEPLGQSPAQGESQVRDAIEQVLEFVAQTDVKSLGGIGLAVLLFTVVKLMGHVEGALNATFGIRRLRTVPRRIADYTAMATISPILALSATALWAAGRSQGAMGYLRTELDLGVVLDLLFELVPFGVFTVGFTLLFLVMPNTRVRFRSALIGGVVAAVLWMVAQRVYVEAQVGVASYNSLYAGFAAIPLFLIWTWMSWMVVLMGAEFAHADQNHRSYGDLRLASPSTQADVERTGLRILVRMAGRFLNGGTPWTQAELVDDLAAPTERVAQALELLLDAKLVLAAELERGETGWTFAVDPSGIQVDRALRALRGEGGASENLGEIDRVLDEQLAALDAAAHVLDENLDLNALVTRIEERAG